MQRIVADASEFPAHVVEPPLFPVERQLPVPSAPIPSAPVPSAPVPSAPFPVAQQCPSLVAAPAPAAPGYVLAALVPAAPVAPDLSELEAPVLSELGAPDLSELGAPTPAAATELLKQRLTFRSQTEVYPE